jgi:plasmid stability protein
MAQFVVRNLEESVKVKLQRRARRHRRSMEEEAREILRAAVQRDEDTAGGLGSDIASLFKKHGLDEEIAELRGHVIEAPVFEQ